MYKTSEGVSQKYRKFIKLPYREKILLSEALFFQLLVGLLLKIIPFKWIPRLFSNPSAIFSQIPGNSSHRTPLSAHLRYHSSTLEEIKAATWRAGRISPWKNKCLVRSLAARWMLRNRKIQSQLSLGVASDNDKKLVAHAWLKADDFEVVEKNGEYKELYLF
jgi:hypothetical protein